MHAQSRAKQPSPEALVTLHTTGAAHGAHSSPYPEISVLAIEISCFSSLFREPGTSLTGTQADRATRRASA